MHYSQLRFWALVAMAIASSHAQHWQVDDSFAPAIEGRIEQMLVQPDGKVIIVGTLTQLNGTALTAARTMVRLNTDGSTDTTFAASLADGESITRLFLQPAGKIIATGTFRAGAATYPVAQFNADGTRERILDLTNANVSTLEVDPAGFLYAVTSGATPRLVRYTPAGVLDASFQSALVATPSRFVPLADGGVLVMLNPSVIRLRHDGSVDPAFGVERGWLGTIVHVTALPDGGAVTWGQSGQAGPAGFYLSASRINRDGAIDYTFAGRPTASSPHIDSLAVGGVLFDLLLDFAASAPAAAWTQANLVTLGTSASVAVNSTGRLIALVSWTDDRPRQTFRAHRRASLASPSVDAAPTVFAPGLASLTVPQGYTLMLSGAGTGLFPLAYQWNKDGVPLAGANASILTITDTNVEDAGVYSLTASNAHGTATGEVRRISVHSTARMPLITEQPRSRVVAAGESVTLSVAVSGGSFKSYRWAWSGGRAEESDDPTFTIANVQPADARSYSVVVTGSVSTVSGNFSYRLVSSTATLTVIDFPFAGNYFGTLPGGDAALTTRDDGSGALLINLASSGRVIVADRFTPAANGTFVAHGDSFVSGGSPGTGSPVVLTGSFLRDGTAHGAVVGEDISFAILRTETSAGSIYQAQALGTAEGWLRVVTNASGRAIAVGKAGSDVFGGTGTMSSGRFTIASPGGGTLEIRDDGRGHLSASGTGATPAPWSFAGLREDVVRVDRLANISTRGRAGAGDAALVAGFVVTGTASRTILVRAVGPALADFGIGDPITAPRLTLFRGSAALHTSDQWGAGPGAGEIPDVTTRLGAFPLRYDSPDAVILTGIEPGNYTAVISSRNAGSGVALVEIYDDFERASTASRLANISTRGHVGVGEDMLIAGIVVTGNAPKRLLIRGIGPGLGQFGLTGVLADPVLTILAGQSTLAENDDWGGSGASVADVLAAATSVGAFALTPGSRDACVLVTLQPGNYTAQVHGKAAGTGIALVEVYELPE